MSLFLFEGVGLVLGVALLAAAAISFLAAARVVARCKSAIVLGQAGSATVFLNKARMWYESSRGGAETDVVETEIHSPAACTAK